MEANTLCWFIHCIGTRIYPISNPETVLHAKDGVYVEGKRHAMRLYLDVQLKNIKYSKVKRWNF
jgi:hypothetical protein